MQYAIGDDDEVFAGLKQAGNGTKQQIIEALQQSKTILLQIEEGLGAICSSRCLSRYIEVGTPERDEALQFGDCSLDTLYIYAVARETENVEILVGEIVLQHQSSRL